MKLQTAIDRVSLSQAEEMVKMFAGKTDIIEIGTSLIKDYGLLSLNKLNDYKKSTLLLADLKTCDEGAYEFQQGFEQGFDILTVMGNSSRETLEKCYEVSESYGKTMLIDLLECSEEKIQEIADFENAVYCLHTSVDKKTGGSPVEEIRRFKKIFPKVKRISAAGGITLDTCKEIQKEEIEWVIVGSAITKAEDMEKALKQFKEELA